MIYKRKEAKDYGCKKMVEGVFKPNEKFLVIEDVVVYGTSIIETSQVFFFLTKIVKLHVFILLLQSVLEIMS